MTRRSFFLILSFLSILILAACGEASTTASLTTASTTTSSASSETTTSSVLVETTTTSGSTSTTTPSTTTTTPVPLAIPSGIVCEDGTLVWDPVDGATGYVLELDGTEYLLEIASFDLSAFPDGIHTVRIRSQEGVRRSDYSDSVTFLLVLHPGVPFGLEEEAGSLIWIPVDNATGYRIRYGETSVDVEGASFDLSVFPENAVFSFTVSALFGAETVSDPSLPFLFDTCATELDEIGIRFLKSAPQDLVLDFSTETWDLLGIRDPAGALLDPSSFTFDAGILTISQDFLMNLPYGVRDCRILTDAGYFAFSLEIADDRQPYMISPANVTFNGEDIVLTFEIYDGTVDSLSGNGITDQDYLIQGNTVRISAAYVAAKFANEPERVTLIIWFSLSANEYVSLGHIFIRLPA